MSYQHHGHARKGKQSPEYRIWLSAKNRCYNENYEHFDDYGRRGIVMCDEWLEDFEQFYEDMGPRTSSKHSLDRLDNDGPYAPWNCKWSTKSEQMLNKRAPVTIKDVLIYTTLTPATTPTPTSAWSATEG